jgi:hypothetical protein
VTDDEHKERVAYIRSLKGKSVEDPAIERLAGVALSHWAIARTEAGPLPFEPTEQEWIAGELLMEYCVLAVCRFIVKGVGMFNEREKRNKADDN